MISMLSESFILENVLGILYAWLPLSLGVWMLLGKMKETMAGTRRWMAWLPGLRYAAIGDAVEIGRCTCLQD